MINLLANNTNNRWNYLHFINSLFATKVLLYIIVVFCCLEIAEYLSIEIVVQNTTVTITFLGQQPRMWLSQKKYTTHLLQCKFNPWLFCYVFFYSICLKGDNIFSHHYNLLKKIKINASYIKVTQEQLTIKHQATLYSKKKNWFTS